MLLLLICRRNPERDYDYTYHYAQVQRDNDVTENELRTVVGERVAKATSTKA